ncbi:MAG TPA: hypothetical protein VFV97_04420 [Rhodanobacteraceae bacterium]|nr:hypothetical protein [Rhodanobacteraceae bacterium]
MTSIASAAIPATERAVLTDFYTSTHGEGWVDATNWNGTAGTECTWFGITCDAAGAHVVGIALPDNKLAGPLPVLDALAELTVLDVHSNDCLYLGDLGQCVPDPNSNHLQGPLPALTGLAHFQRLYAHAAGFSGTMPSLAGHGALVTYDVGSNDLTGRLPTFDGLDALEDLLVGFSHLTGSIPPLTLPNLRNFDVTGTALTGSIPPLNQLSRLETFRARYTTLTGSIPSLAGLANLLTFDVGLSTLDGTIGSLSGLTNLVTFDANYNTLTGAIPPLSGLTHLVTFDVHHNRLSGSIPALAGLTALNTFEVWGNQLSGAVPSLAGLSNLAWFNAQFNQLTGPLPALTGLSHLWYFAVSFNEITGPIPALSNQGLDSLSQLMLDHNRLTGSIPSLSGLSNLNYVTVRENQLTGSLPALDASLTSFGGLDAAHNQLTGPIPDYSALPGEGYQLDVSSNALTGSIAPSLAKFGAFAASDNHLTGSIPDVFSAGTLTYFDVGFNDLTGSPPAPTSQMEVYGHGSLCPNHLTHTPSAAWDAIVGHSPWYDGCASSYVNPDQFGLTGAWYDVSDPGKGFLIDAMPDHAGPGIGTYFGGWFNFLCEVGCPGGTPDALEAQQQWFSFQDNVDATNPYVRQTVYESRGGSFDAPPTVGATPVGMFTIAFDDCSHALLRYHVTTTIGYADRSVRLTRLTPNVACTTNGAPAAVPATNTLLSGAWYDPATAGQGLVFDINAEHGILFAAWYAYAVDGADQDPTFAQRWYTLQAEIAGDTRSFSGVTIYSSVGGSFDGTSINGYTVTTTPVGSADVSFQSCSALTIDYRFTSGEIAGHTGTLHLARLSPVPAGCTD